MIGKAIRNFAQERGLTCDGGMAYGMVNGRLIAMYEGDGYKALRIYLYPPVEQGEEFAQRDAQILQALTDCDLKEFRLKKKGAVSIEAGFAQLIFQDFAGSMKRIVRYVDEIMPKLDQIGLDTNRCACCGQPLNDEDRKYIQLDGNILPLHADCVQQLSALVEDADAQSRAGGSLLRGALGALVGAVIGAIPWALVFLAGYVAALVGLLIGYLSSWMYDKFGGKKSKLKILIVAIAVIIGVVLGQIGGYSAQFAKEYQDYNGGMDGCVEYVGYLWRSMVLGNQEETLRAEYQTALESLTPEELEGAELMTEDEFVETYYDSEWDEMQADLQEELVRNCALGLFYGLLGCLGLFMQLHRQNKRRSVRSMK